MSNPFENMEKSNVNNGGDFLTRGTSIVEITGFTMRRSQKGAGWVCKIEGIIVKNVVKYAHEKSPQKNTNREGTSFTILYLLDGVATKDSPKLGEIRQFISAMLGVPLSAITDGGAFEFATACTADFNKALVDYSATPGEAITPLIEVTGILNRDYVNARFRRDDDKAAEILGNETFEPTVILIEE